MKIGKQAAFCSRIYMEFTFITLPKILSAWGRILLQYVLGNVIRYPFVWAVSRRATLN